MAESKFKDKMLKKYGPACLGGLDKPELISTGFIGIDKLIGGGIPLGRNTQIFGKPGSGKTTLAMSIAKKFDELGHSIAFIDIEKTYPYDMAEKLGIRDISVFQPTTGEEAVDMVRDCIDGGYKLIILDSVGSMSPSYELNVSADQKGISGLPALISKMIRVTTNSLYVNKASLLCLNHIKVGIGMFSKDSVPGGILLEHSLSCNMQIQAMSTKNYIMNGDDVALKPSWIKVKKSKLKAITAEKTNIYLDNNQVFNKDIDILTNALEMKVIKKTGAFLKYGDYTLGQGILNAIKDVTAKHRKILDNIRLQTIDRIELREDELRLLFADIEDKKKYNKKVDKYSKKWLNEYNNDYDKSLICLPLTGVK